MLRLDEFKLLATQAYKTRFFFKQFRKNHATLMKLKVDGMDGMEFEHARASIYLILRLWANQLKKPKKMNNSHSLFAQACNLVKNDMIYAMALTVSLYLAWDYVKEKCMRRHENAHASDYWNTDATEKSALMWENRYDALNTIQDQTIEYAYDSLNKGNFEDFINVLSELEEIDSEWTMNFKNF